MNALLGSLKQVCSQNLVGEKLILVPTLMAGQQLLQGAVQAGVPCLNLKVDTVIGLCTKASSAYMQRHKLKLCSSRVTEYLVLRVMRSLARAGRLQYFQRLEMTSGVAKAVAEALLDLKLAGLDLGQIDEQTFLDSRKGIDLKQVFAGYQARLQSYGLLDKADVLNLGAPHNSATLYIDCGFLELARTEQAILDNMPTVKLTGDQEFTARLSMFQAYGESNEVREVMRQIKGQSQSLDRVLVLCTTNEPYTQLLFDLAQLYKLPITFGCGVEVRNSRVGRYAYELLAEQTDKNVLLKAFVQEYMARLEGYEDLTDLDKDTKNSIIAQLQELLVVIDEQETVTLVEAEEVIRGILAGINIGQSLPRPGHIHVDRFESGMWMQREHVYILGLDGNRFPGYVSEDPILLDVERRRLEQLELKGTRPRQKLATMHSVLASISGSVTLSYSCFDTVANKEVFPGGILLELYRKQCGDESKDYGDLLASFGTCKGFVPEVEALDTSEWYLQQLTREKGEASQVMTQFPYLQQGIKAWEARLAPGYSAYEGKVTVDANKMDPRRNSSMIMSSSQLEKLGTCPYGYFLKYILGIEPQPEVQLEADHWLDPVTRGTVLHAVFEQFLRTLQERGERPELDKHLDLIKTIALAKLEIQRQEVPPPNDVIFAEECKEIIESCRVFLASEAAEAKDWDWVALELAFGPLQLTLPDGSCIRVRGKIDRVDKGQDGYYKVWDYKTGSTFGYTEQSIYKGGRQLQHTLYAAAFETLMQEQGKAALVQEGGYLFPTVKGEGRRLLRPQEDRTNFYAIVQQLINFLVTGNFVMTDKDEDCSFCDYRPICNRHIVGQAWADKCEPIKGVRQYE